MFEGKLTIEVPGLAAALEHLAAAIACREQTPPAAPVAAPVTHPAAPMGDPAPYPAPAAAVPTSGTAAPINPTQTPGCVPGPGPAPVAPPPSYTHDQVGKAGADLIAANPAKMQELMSLLQQFSVPAITALKPEQLGAFATALRGLGAKI